MMKHKKYFITLLISLYAFTETVQLSAVLTMSQYKPDSTFQKPYFNQDYFTRIDSNFSGGFAQHAYNAQGNKVNFMQQFGTEDLLERFVNTDLPVTDTTSMGQGLLNGQFHVREMILQCYKNINHGFFIEIATAIQDLTINTISVEYQKNINPTPDQITYLENLQSILPHSINSSGMFTTALFTGYHKSFMHFEHLDFIDIQIKTGIMSPQAMNYSSETLLQFPFIGNYNFGYPVIITSSLGVLDWLTIGASGAIIPWQNALITMSMNTQNTNNSLLLTQSGIVSLHRNPLFTGSLYIEADHFYQGLSLTAGYCYTHNGQYFITPTNQYLFPEALVSQSPLLNSWNLGSVYVQFDIDFACEVKPNAPVILFFTHIPVLGTLTPETNIFGGDCGFQISYLF